MHADAASTRLGRPVHACGACRRACIVQTCLIKRTFSDEGGDPVEQGGQCRCLPSQLPCQAHWRKPKTYFRNSATAALPDGQYFAKGVGRQHQASLLQARVCAGGRGSPGTRGGSSCQLNTRRVRWLAGSLEMPLKRWFRHKQISATCFRVVEVNDLHGEWCHCYIRLGSDKCVLIDTSCGTHDLRGYIDEHINTDKLPYQVICTHSHYDHIGSNYQFPEGICFGGADAAFTQSNQGQRKPYKDGTWGDAVQQFTIKTWLQDGDVIPLGGNESLHVMHTPGHSPDSITLWDPAERRLFVGDFLYPHADWDDIMSPPGGLYAVQRGADLYAYLSAVQKLHSFIESESGNGQSDITLACGHNSFSLDAAFVGSVIKLFSGIRDGVLEPRDVVLWGMDVWEYVCPSDTRASVVVPKGLKGRLYKYGEEI